MGLRKEGKSTDHENLYTAGLRLHRAGIENVFPFVLSTLDSCMHLLGCNEKTLCTSCRSDPLLTSLRYVTPGANAAYLRHYDPCTLYGLVRRVEEFAVQSIRSGCWTSEQRLLDRRGRVDLTGGYCWSTPSIVLDERKNDSFTAVAGLVGMDDVACIS